MIGTAIFFALMIVIMGLIAGAFSDSFKPTAAAIAVGGVLIICANAYESLDSTKALRAQEQKAELDQQIADQKPRVISEADGCKVYAFKSAGRWQHFTRCESQTTTTTDRTVSCGKHCKRTESDVITTENKR